MKFDQLIRQQEDLIKVGSMNSLISMFTDKFKNVIPESVLANTLDCSSSSSWKCCREWGIVYTY